MLTSEFQVPEMKNPHRQRQLPVRNQGSNPEKSSKLLFSGISGCLKEEITQILMSDPVPAEIK